MIVSRLRGRSVPTCTPSLNGQPLERVSWSCFDRWLNMVYSHRESKKDHRTNIYRQFYSMTSTPSLYTSLVRPHLEYATQVFLIKDIQKLESVQKFVLKMCCKSWDLSYSEYLQQSLLPELSFRRQYLSLSYCCNLVHGRFEFPGMPATLRQPTYSNHASSTLCPL